MNDNSFTAPKSDEIYGDMQVRANPSLLFKYVILDANYDILYYGLYVLT